MHEANEPPQQDEAPAPNICFRCRTDYGNVALPQIAGLPVCNECARYFRNREFPGWIKGSFAALILLAILAFVYNERFFFAHIDMLRGVRELQKGNIERSVALFDAAAQRVPDEPELRAVSRYFQAVLLVSQERSGEAIPLLKEALAIKPDEPEYATALQQAEAGAAYERKDYDAFLEMQQKLARQQPDDPIAALGIASAHACRYAVSGEASLKTLAEQQIEVAARMKGADAPTFAEYVDRIRYRLETREVISRKEYQHRFPNGRNTKSSGTGGGG